MTHARLYRKSSIITGGTRGIGRALVETFRQQGSEVLFTGRDKSAGEELRRATGAHFLAADALDPAHASSIAGAAARLFGHVDVLINNAGHSGPRDKIASFDPASFDDAIAVHLRAPWELMSLVVPLMRKRDGGSIVNMASVAAHRVGAASITYAVSKAALVHLTRYAAAELGKYNIRVNSISPGFVPTRIHTSSLHVDDGHAEALIEGMARFYSSRQAIPEPVQTADIANAAVYLASDEARMVSGSDLVIDGGMMWGANGLRLADSIPTRRN